MSVLAFNNTNQFHYSWLQSLAGNVIRYGCTSRPKHIAIVMDGNRRYAREKNVERAEGHSLGADRLFEVCQWCYDLGVNEVSVYAFSLENLKRSQDEVETLMNIARHKLKEIEKNLEQIHAQKICIRIIGKLDLLPEDIRQSSYRLMNETDQYKNFILNVCLYYTSRNEIAGVLKDLAKGCENRLIEVNDIERSFDYAKSHRFNESHRSFTRHFPSNIRRITFERFHVTSMSFFVMDFCRCLLARI